jgi:hypothetical protein
MKLKYAENLGSKYFAPQLGGAVPVAESEPYRRPYGALSPAAQPGRTATDTARLAAFTQEFQRRRRPRAYAAEPEDAGDSSVVTPEVLAAVMTAIERTDWFQGLMHLLRRQRGANTSVPQDGQPAGLSAPAEAEAYHKAGETLRARRRETTVGDHDSRVAAYSKAHEADAAYRASRQSSSDRARRLAERRGCTYDEALGLLGIEPALPLLPAAVT